MPKRTTNYDAVERLKHPLWMTAKTMYGRTVLNELVDESIKPINALVLLMARYINDGWTVESFSSGEPTCFCNKGDERLCLQIVGIDPDESIKSNMISTGMMSKE